MSKIFPQVYLKFDLKYFYSIIFRVLLLSKQMNSNNLYITTSCIPYNIYSYSYIITVIVYPFYRESLVTNLDIAKGYNSH